MFRMLVGTFGIIMGFFGVFTNIYILIVLLFHKKTRNGSEWILLHLSTCGVIGSFSNILLISPPIMWDNWITAKYPLCDIVGSFSLIIQLLTIWCICALSADRCAAILSPLRYTQVVTQKRIGIFFLLIWILSILIILISYFFGSFQNEKISSSTILVPSSHQINSIEQHISGSIQTSTNTDHPLSLSDPFFSINRENISFDNDYFVNNEDENLQFNEFLLPYSSKKKLRVLDLRFPVDKSRNIRSKGSFESREAKAIQIPQSKSRSTSLQNEIFYSYSTNERNHNEVKFKDEENEYEDKVENGRSFDDFSTNYHPISRHKNDQSENTLDLELENEQGPYIFRPLVGTCLPFHNVTLTYLNNVIWITIWLFFSLILPLIIILVCDSIVLSIARKQRHRIAMALYQITLSAQVTVTRNKGTTPPPALFMNRTVPARSRACRAVWEDLGSIMLLNALIISITISEILSLENEDIVDVIVGIGSVINFLIGTYNALFYGVRARPIRNIVRSYMRKRMTNSTLQQEIQQRLSPVDGSPRLSSRAKAFRSSSASPNSSISDSPRRLSSNDLRPPQSFNFFLTNSPSSGQLSKRTLPRGGRETGPRKVRSFLHIPTQLDMQEFWTGLKKPNRSPTIIITHELRIKDSVNSLVSSTSSPAEHML